MANGRAERSPVRRIAGLSARRLRHRFALLSVDLAGIRVRDVLGRAPSRSATCRSREMFDRYELYTYKQWLRVYMRSKMIKHNKDLFALVDDPLALLTKTTQRCLPILRSRMKPSFS